VALPNLLLTALLATVSQGRYRDPAMPPTIA
jgi:hypothetical protein